MTEPARHQAAPELFDRHVEEHGQVEAISRRAPPIVVEEEVVALRDHDAVVGLDDRGGRPRELEVPVEDRNRDRLAGGRREAFEHRRVACRVERERGALAGPMPPGVEHRVVEVKAVEAGDGRDPIPPGPEPRPPFSASRSASARVDLPTAGGPAMPRMNLRSRRAASGGNAARIRSTDVSIPPPPANGLAIETGSVRGRGGARGRGPRPPRAHAGTVFPRR